MKRQFCRLQHICTWDEDYALQGYLLKQKFEEKEYPFTLDQEAFKTYLNGHNTNHTRMRVKANTTLQPLRLTTQFHVNVGGILQEDFYLKSSIMDKPKILYRRAFNIKSKIAPSRMKTPKKALRPTLTFLSIRACSNTESLILTYKHVQHCQKHFTTNGKACAHNGFYNCSTEFVIYCLSCPCGLLYMHRTIRTIRKRFGKHRWSVEEGTDKLSVPEKHSIKYHCLASESGS